MKRSRTAESFALCSCSNSELSTTSADMSSERRRKSISSCCATGSLSVVQQRAFLSRNNDPSLLRNGEPLRCAPDRLSLATLDGIRTRRVFVRGCPRTLTSANWRVPYGRCHYQYLFGHIIANSCPLDWHLKGSVVLQDAQPMTSCSPAAPQP